MTLTEFRILLREKIEKAGGVRAFARKYDISAAHVSDVATSKREPGPTMLGIFRFTKRVKITRAVTIEKA